MSTTNDYLMTDDDERQRLTTTWKTFDDHIWTFRNPDCTDSQVDSVFGIDEWIAGLITDDDLDLFHCNRYSTLEFRSEECERLND